MHDERITRTCRTDVVIRSDEDAGGGRMAESWMTQAAKGLEKNQFHARRF